MEKRLHPKKYNYLFNIIKIVLLGFALFCCIFSSITVKENNHLAGILWILGITFSFLFIVVIDRKSIHNMVTVKNIHLYELLSITGIICLALILRIFYWTSYPLYIHNDEASCGLYSRMINDGSREWFSIGWYGLPMIAYTIGSLGLKIFGNTIYGLRYANGIVGVIGILFTYLLAKKIYSHRVALISAILLSVMYIHILFSNNGLQDIQGPTLITISLYFFIIFLNKPAHIKGFLLGVILIFNFVFYWGARASFLIIGFSFLFALWSNKKLIYTIRPYVKTVIFGLIIAGLPIYSIYKTIPGSFNDHTQEVLIINNTPQMITHLTGQFGVINYTAIAGKQLWATILTFFTLGDQSLQIGYNKPFLDFTMSSLLPISLVLIFITIKNNWKKSCLIFWIVVIFIASALTSDAPWWPRLASLTPAFAIIIAFGLDYITNIYRSVLKKIILSTFLIIISVSNIKIAAKDYPEYAYKRYAAPTVIASYIKYRDDSEYNILLADYYTTFEYETFPFLVPGKKTCTVNLDETVDHCLELGKPTLIFSMPGNEAKLEYIHNMFPRGNLYKIKDNTIDVYELLN